MKNAHKDQPLVSIITVVYNGEAYLEQTIRSVLEQTYANIEYIIIDGGSTDGTVDIIKKYEKYIAYWISEKDEGIYDAMNKGIKAASGEIIGLLNADDYYVDSHVLSKVKNAFSASSADVVYGDIFLKTQTSTVLSKAHIIGLKYKLFPYSLNWIWAGMIIGHPASFIKKNIYDEIGVYDTRFKISADYDFIFKVINAKKKFYYLPEPLVFFRDGGVSTSNLKQKYKEDKVVRVKNNWLFGHLVNMLFSIQRFIKSMTL